VKRLQEIVSRNPSFISYREREVKYPEEENPEQRNQKTKQPSARAL
jgi:hypothetical protein